MVFHNNDNKIRKEDRNSELSQNGRLLPYETLSSSWYCLLFFKAIFRVFFFFFFEIRVVDLWDWLNPSLGDSGTSLLPCDRVAMAGSGQMG